MRNKVFIATSLDGYIADENGDLDWLTQFPQPTNGDAGYSAFMNSIDAILMGRKTFEKVLSFGIEWPYTKKVFIWTTKTQIIPSEHQDKLKEKIEPISGQPRDLLKLIHAQGFFNLYIDGGQAIQSFMNENLIHELIITTAPVILGKGIPLFHHVPKLRLRHEATEAFDNGMVQSRYMISNA